MELLYLWIEDYKNIKQQGFNFSPLYDFHFEPDKPDENGKIISGTLTDNIKEEDRAKKRDFYNGFFGDGISNVTAIVGENGAGKSSILEMNYTFCVYSINDNLYFSHMYEYSRFTIRTNIDNRQIQLHKEKGLIVYYSNSFSFPNVDVYVENISSVNIITENWITAYKERSEEKFKIFDAISQCEFVSKFNNKELPFKLPPAILITIPLEREMAKLNSYIEEMEINSKIIKRYSELYHKELIIAQFFKKKCTEQIKNNLDKNVIKEELFLCLLQWTILLNFFNSNLLTEASRFEMIKDTSLYELAINRWFDTFFDDHVKSYYSESGLSEWEGIYKGWAENTTKLVSFIDKMIKQKKIVFDNRRYRGGTSFFGSVDDINLSEYLAQEWANEPYVDIAISLKTSSDLDMKNLSIFLEKYKNLIWYNRILSDGFFNFTWWNMSAGEMSFLSLLSRLNSINFTIEGIKDKPSAVYMNREIDSLIILLDEPEIGWHPQWQKLLLNNLLDTLPKIFPDKQIQLILTSHSPFLVSDLPKENVIFLEKEENTGLCKVSKLESMKHTFGANIHTLLTDSFFMKGGLVGEFAQTKIDEVIKLLDKSKLEKEEIEHCEMIISMIGEPIVKTMLQKLLDSKRLRKVDKHSTEIEKLRKRIEELEKNNSNDS
ncbi:AAA family ATPase [Bernardetia sp. OM2101]|uniref:AAA family ATPase n=1 Tax=Bernardetia sp. OM2101 TaxID=3344876 RepID=UPI0035D0E4CE